VPATVCAVLFDAHVSRFGAPPLFAVFAMLACVAVAAPARAGGEPYDYVAVEGFAAGWTSMPWLSLDGSGAPRRLVDLPFPGVPTTLYGGGIDLTLRDYRYVLRAGFDAASGAGVAGYATANDGSVSIQTAALGFLRWRVSGGFQQVGERFKVEELVGTGLELAWGSATMTDASGAAYDGQFGGVAWFLRVEIAGCVSLWREAPRVDVVTGRALSNGADTRESSKWACLVAAPNVVELPVDAAPGATWLDGFAAALRVEL
jgi:hypothetical protein